MAIRDTAVRPATLQTLLQARRRRCSASLAATSRFCGPVSPPRPRLPCRTIARSASSRVDPVRPSSHSPERLSRIRLARWPGLSELSNCSRIRGARVSWASRVAQFSVSPVRAGVGEQVEVLTLLNQGLDRPAHVSVGRCQLGRGPLRRRTERGRVIRQHVQGQTRVHHRGHPWRGARRTAGGRSPGGGTPRLSAVVERQVKVRAARSRFRAASHIFVRRICNVGATGDSRSSSRTPAIASASPSSTVSPYWSRSLPDRLGPTTASITPRRSGRGRKTLVREPPPRPVPVPVRRATPSGTRG